MCCLQSVSQISKSMDSLLTVASGIILPQQVTVLQSNTSSSSRYEKLFSNVSRLGVTVAPGGQIRRHSYDITTQKQREDSSEYFDCHDYILDSDKMASSLEIPPEVQFNVVVHNDSMENGQDITGGCRKQKCAVPSDVTKCVASVGLFPHVGTDNNRDSTLPHSDAHGRASQNVVGCSHGLSVTVQANHEQVGDTFTLSFSLLLDMGYKHMVIIGAHKVHLKTVGLRRHTRIYPHPQ